MAFKVGDLVQLKSGGPKMTVDQVIDDERVYAVWFAGAKREREGFAIETLLPVQESETNKTIKR